ncbi:MAG TPA: VWA domain-containing protein [Polyangia bacterium]|nr:VWA domain-containing protein [Polyangia bacterium]
MPRGKLCLALSAVLTLACAGVKSGPSGTGGTGQTPGGAAAGAGGSGYNNPFDAAATDDASSRAPTPSADGRNCGLQSFGLQNIPPDLLVVLDKSISMSDQPDGTSCRRVSMCASKWSDMTDGIGMVVSLTEATIRWGLKVFPNDGGCTVDPGAAVGVAANNAATIKASIGGMKPGGTTPTRAAITTAATYLAGLTDPNPKFILLATDGIPTCSSDGTNQDVGAAQAIGDVARAGIPVFVLGVGDVATAVDTLNAMAVNGGRAQAGPTKYYPVGNTADLVSVLTMISGQIASCTFGLDEAPPVPDNVGVYGDGTKIPADPTHANGWDYGADMKSIQLFGPACDDVRNRVTKQVQAVYGCPGSVIP